MHWRGRRAGIQDERALRSRSPGMAPRGGGSCGDRGPVRQTICLVWETAANSRSQSNLVPFTDFNLYEPARVPHRPRQSRQSKL